MKNNNEIGIITGIIWTGVLTIIFKETNIVWILYWFAMWMLGWNLVEIIKYFTNKS